MASTLPKLLPAKNVARLLRVPVKWLTAEADAGRLPHVKADDVYLFDFEATEQSLVDRARSLPKAEGGPS